MSMIGRTTDGSVWEHRGDSWYLMAPTDSPLAEEIFVSEGGVVIYEESALSGLEVGSIVSDEYGGGIVAVKNGEGSWIITGEGASGYTDDELDDYFEGYGYTYEVVRGAESKK